MYNRKDIFYKLFANTRGGAMFKNIPIVLLDDLKKSFANDGNKYRIRYRGPRAHNVTRHQSRRQSTCLKKDAVRFIVYRTY